MADEGGCARTVQVKGSARAPLRERCHVPDIVKGNALTVPGEQRTELEKRLASRADAVQSPDGFEWFELVRLVEDTDAPRRRTDRRATFRGGVTARVWRQPVEGGGVGEAASWVAAQEESRRSRSSESEPGSAV